MFNFVFGVFVVFIILILVIFIQGTKYFKKDSDQESYREALKSVITVSLVSAIVFLFQG